MAQAEGWTCIYIHIWYIFQPLLCARCWTTKMKTDWAESSYDSSTISLFVKIGGSESEVWKCPCLLFFHCTKSEHRIWPAQYLLVNFCFVRCNKNSFENMSTVEAQNTHSEHTSALSAPLLWMWSVQFLFIDFLLLPVSIQRVFLLLLLI